MTAIKPIAFLGLGRLGRPVAANLLAAGYPLRLWNRTAAKAETLVTKGATRVDRPIDAVEPGGILVTLLWDNASVEDVLRPDLIEKLGDGVHISMSTLSPDFSEALAARHSRLGSSLVEAPIFGVPDAAAARKLFVPISGPAAAKSRVRTLIEAMGAQAIFDFGEAPGAATMVKVAGNFLILSASASLREAFAVAHARGVEPAALLDLLTKSLFPSPVYEMHGRLAAEGSPRLGQSGIPAKDLGLFKATATAAGIEAQLGDILLRLFAPT